MNFTTRSWTSISKCLDVRICYETGVSAETLLGINWFPQAMGAAEAGLWFLWNSLPLPARHQPACPGLSDVQVGVSVHL